jgi:hypothetical protein
MIAELASFAEALLGLGVGVLIAAVLFIAASWFLYPNRIEPNDWED